MEKLGYRPALDGIRAVAILLVVAAHAGWLSGGTLGVDLFFVLSGFLITTLLIEEHQTTNKVSLPSFYARRALRLLPALWLLLIAYVAYGLVNGHHGSPGHVLGAAAIGIGYVANFFAAAWSPSQAHYLMHLWSLAQEEQFYLLWPVALVAFLRRDISSTKLLRGLMVLLVGGAVLRWFLVLGGASYFRISFAPDTNLDPLAIGCTAGILWTRKQIRVGGWFAVAAALVVVASVVLVPLVSDERGRIVAISAPWFPLACAAILLYLIDNQSTTAARTMSVRPLRYVGKISYGIYLWHFPLMHLGGVVAGLVMTAVAAPVSYRYLEAPIRRAGAGKLSRRHRPQSADPVSGSTIATPPEVPTPAMT
jgi:peptidoglycan/LPS O-acetylase OafA/YrhL